MIINFSIQNFGCIKDKQVLSFEATKSTDLEDYYVINVIGGLRLLKLGLIYGANASGKSTVLKALNFLRYIVLKPADKKTIDFNFSPFLFDAKTPNQNTILSIDFIQNKVRYFYEVELNKKSVIRDELYFYNPNRANVFKRVTNTENQFTEITFGNKIKKDRSFVKILEANTLWNNTVLGGFLKTNINIAELKEATDWFSKYLEPIINSNTDLVGYTSGVIDLGFIKNENIIQILRKADFNISNILIEGTEIDITKEFLDLVEKQNNIGTKQIEDFKNKGKCEV